MVKWSALFKVSLLFVIQITHFALAQGQDETKQVINEIIKNIRFVDYYYDTPSNTFKPRFLGTVAGPAPDTVKLKSDVERYEAVKESVGQLHNRLSHLARDGSPEVFESFKTALVEIQSGNLVLEHSTNSTASKYADVHVPSLQKGPIVKRIDLAKTENAEYGENLGHFPKVFAEIHNLKRGRTVDLEEVAQNDRSLALLHAEIERELITRSHLKYPTREDGKPMEKPLHQLSREQQVEWVVAGLFSLKANQLSFSRHPMQEASDRVGAGSSLDRGGQQAWANRLLTGLAQAIKVPTCHSGFRRIAEMVSASGH